MRRWILVGLVLAAGCNESMSQDFVRLTHHPAEDRAPAWSPDGTRLAFESDRLGRASIYVIGVDGSNVERLTSTDHDDHYPTWSPDGTRIAFQSKRGDDGGLWVKELDSGEEALMIADSSPELTPDWSPDGGFIAFTSKRAGNADLWAVPISGGEPVRLTSNSFRDAWPRFSPDGRSLVFFSRRDTDGERDELYVFHWRSREIERITRNPTHHDFTPDWSADGERIVTAVSDSDEDRAIVVYDSSGRLLVRFAGGFHRVFQPTWSPDGRWIAFAARAFEGERADLYLAPAPPR